MRDQLYKKLKKAVKEGLEMVIKLERENKTDSLFWFFRYHNQYPTLSSSDGNMPNFYLSDYEKKDYSAVLLDKERFLEIESWREYHNWAVKEPNITKRYAIGEFSFEFYKDNPGTRLSFEYVCTYNFLAQFTDSYVHRFSTEYFEENFIYLFERFYNFVSLEHLPFDIIIPIIFIPFEVESFTISENISIEEIDKATQISRNRRTSHTASVHPSVIEAATHALVLKNWHLGNSNIYYLYENFNNVNFFNEAIEIANTFFAALRISSPNAETGFAQLIFRPIGWEFKFEADVIQTFVISERYYPDYFEKFGWRNHRELVPNEDLDKIKTCFQAITNLPHLDLAYKRLNKACLNKNNDDAIIDIAIALESLLTSDSRTEINYRLSTRASLLCKKIGFRDFTPQQIFLLCKRIYDFRSSVVHGDKKRQEKGRVVKLMENNEIQIIEIALEFLKHLVWVLIHADNITSPSEIDNLLFE